MRPAKVITDIHDKRAEDRLTSPSLEIKALQKILTTGSGEGGPTESKSVAPQYDPKSNYLNVFLD